MVDRADSRGRSRLCLRESSRFSGTRRTRGRRDMAPFYWHLAYCLSSLSPTYGVRPSLAIYVGSLFGEPSASPVSVPADQFGIVFVFLHWLLNAPHLHVPSEPPSPSRTPADSTWNACLPSSAIPWFHRLKFPDLTAKNSRTEPQGTIVAVRPQRLRDSICVFPLPEYGE